MTKSVAKTKDQLPALVQDFEENTSAGFEDADGDAYAIPFLAILQSGSPQVKKTSGAYLDGAEEGMLLDTVENTVVDSKDGIRVIPCHYRRAFVEWVPRDQGGGFVGEHSVADAPKTERSEDNKDIMENGNELVDTRYHYVLLETAQDVWEPIIIAMTRTQVKKSRRWMMQMQKIKFPKKDGTGFFTPPTFSHIYTLGVVPEQKDEYSWWNWEIKGKEVVEDANAVAAAREFHTAVVSGEVKEATESQAAAAEDSKPGEAPPSF